MNQARKDRLTERLLAVTPAIRDIHISAEMMQDVGACYGSTDNARTALNLKPGQLFTTKEWLASSAASRQHFTWFLHQHGTNALFAGSTRLAARIETLMLELSIAVLQDEDTFKPDMLDDADLANIRHGRSDPAKAEALYRLAMGPAILSADAHAALNLEAALKRRNYPAIQDLSLDRDMFEVVKAVLVQKLEVKPVRKGRAA